MVDAIPVNEEAKTFTGPTAVGGLIESAASTNAATCFSGYIARKIVAYHSSKCRNDLKNCSKCRAILATGNLALIHLFTSFKEYKNNVDPDSGLKYCSEEFVETIINFEKLFLYCFENYSHKYHFDRLVFHAIKSNCPHPVFCNTIMLDYFIKFFIKCRIFQCIKMFNRKQLETRKVIRDKVKKLTSK